MRVCVLRLLLLLRGLSNPDSFSRIFPVSEARSSLAGADAGTEAERLRDRDTERVRIFRRTLTESREQAGLFPKNNFKRVPLEARQT